jgi:hypothetical protein
LDLSEAVAKVPEAEYEVPRSCWPTIAATVEPATSGQGAAVKPLKDEVGAQFATLSERAYSSATEHGSVRN